MKHLLSIHLLLINFVERGIDLVRYPFNKREIHSSFPEIAYFCSKKNRNNREHTGLWFFEGV